MFHLFFLIVAVSAHSFSIQGKGHYSLRPKTQTNPGFYADRGLLQGTEQSMRLDVETRSNDVMDFHLSLGIFDNPRSAYLGDTAKPEACSRVSEGTNSESTDVANQGSSSQCEGRHQDTDQPRYDSYTPRIREAYVRYGFSHCLLEAGRRGRDWGLGIFLDSGRKPFQNSQSIFDGVSCSVNLQKYQTFAFTVGIDKLSETGSSTDSRVGRTGSNGAFSNSDDIEQIHFSLVYDNTKSSQSLRRQVGIYVANIFGTSKLDRGNFAEPEKVPIDIKYADLYTAIYAGPFVFRNEVLFRLGKSGDPTWAQFGGTVNDSNVEGTYKNDLTAIAFAGDITWQFGRTGRFSGPEEFNEGDAQWHEFGMQYAYAPGDRSGYMTQDERRQGGTNRVGAVAFHRNYKPALILFNSPPELDDRRVDGIFDPDRVMNANVLTLGYKYNSLNVGNYGIKFITASMDKGIPQEYKTQIHNSELQGSTARRPFGYSGKHIGYELDLMFDMNVRNYLNFGIDLAMAFPGAAWRDRANKAPDSSYLLQAHTSFFF
jgi:hypothetical protein